MSSLAYKSRATSDQVEEIEQEINANRKCLHVCCFPDIFLRKKLGKRVKNMLDNDVTILKEDPIFSGGTMFVDAPRPMVEKEPLPITIGETIDCLVQKILKLVSDDKIRKIGLWGMGGVGKTTIMKKLNNELEHNGEFDFVIWVTVSKDWSVTDVQNEIMQRLGMNRMDNESNNSAARRLLRKLEAKKYLLLLDDVWFEVNLEAVGIPPPDNTIGRKIVLTTRNLRVCRQMGTDEDIKVEVLSEEEAWRLFHKKVGDVINSPNIEPIARQVVEECDGLPLAIIVIGGSMRKVEEVHAWETALEELKSGSSEINDMEDKVFNQLKFSYDRLKSDNVKNCFLYCALYPEDYKIPVDELVRQWRDEGFIEGMESLEKAYKKGLTIKDGLIGDSLLEGVDDDYVKMHDVIRDLALRIISPSGEGPRFFVRVSEGIQECGNMGEWEEAERIFLMGRSLNLPASPTCNSLCTLLLKKNSSVGTMPELFFQHMPRLRVVNLSWAGRCVLPPSVSNLVNLRALYINGGVDLPSEIGALERLEVFHMDGIISLPSEVRELTSLKSLRVEFGWNGEEAMRRMCCDGVVSCLCLLEDLRFGFGRPATDSLMREWGKMVEVGGVVEEVGSLKHLTSLKFEFPTTKCLDEFVKKRSMMNCPPLTRSCLSVKCLDTYTYGRGKKLIWGPSGESSISSGMMELFRQGISFSLMYHKTVEKLSHFGIQKLNQLQSCSVVFCLAMESIVSVADGTGGTIILPNLQILNLNGLPNLKSICDYPIRPPPSFTALKELSIFGCEKLSSVFTRSMIQHMSNLEELEVRVCENMEEIVALREAEDQVDDAVLFFPRLKRLELRSVNKLVRIWKGVSQTWPSLNEVFVGNCPNLKTLNLKLMDNVSSSSSPPSSALREIKGEREWWEALEWEHNDDQQQLQPLF